MNKELNKFKKKIYLEALIKSLIYGTAISLFAVAVLLILSKYSIIKLPTYVFIVIGFAAAIAVTAAIFYMIKPNELDLAKRLDKEFNLDEKISTMIHLKNSDNPMAVVQRENACEELSKISPKKLSIKVATLGFLTLLLSGGSLAYSIATPKKGKPDIVIDGSGDVDVNDPLDEIINRVEFANINEIIKEKLLEILRNVLNYVNDTTKTTEEKISYIDKAINDVYYIELHDLTRYDIGGALMKFNGTLNIGRAIKNNDPKDVKSSLDEKKAEFNYLKDTGLDNGLKAFAKDVRDALELSGAPEDDELYVALETLAKTLDTLAKKVKKDKIYENMEAAIEKAKMDILEALKNQDAAEEMCDEVIDLLEEIKKMLEDPSSNPQDSSDNSDSTSDQKPDDSKPDDTKPDDTNDDEKGNSDDKSELIYAGNDVVYDPVTNTNVEYGTVIDDYYKDLINNTNNGNVDKNLEDMMNDYFKSLYYDGNGSEE